MPEETYPSVNAGCQETESDVLFAEADSGEPGCPICGHAPDEHPAEETPNGSR